MLDNFIETNNTISHIITLPTETKMDYAVSKNLFPKNLAVDVELFITKDNDAFICVKPIHKELDYNKIKLIVGDDEFLVANSEESINITGYRKGFLPLISIYGIKFIIDSSLKEKSMLVARVDEKRFLKAEMDEIIQYNEDVEFADIIE